MQEDGGALLQSRRHYAFRFSALRFLVPGGQWPPLHALANEDHEVRVCKRTRVFVQFRK